MKKISLVMVAAILAVSAIAYAQSTKVTRLAFDYTFNGSSAAQYGTLNLWDEDQTDDCPTIGSFACVVTTDNYATKNALVAAINANGGNLPTDVVIVTQRP